MPIYIAMLRGINVGGHKRIKMDQLRTSLEALGLQQVKTYIQSGNVVFKTAIISPAALTKKIEDKILSQFGFPVSVICRTVQEIEKTIKNNPFVNQAGIDHEKFHVAFLSQAPAPAALKKLADLTLAPDQSRCLGREVYLYFPNGVSGSSLWKHPLDGVLSVVTTTRNWRTVNTLHQMCLDCR
ncbi:MAG: DUF1697 domain-containing protein [Candidatus Sulfotelmatobacter sp.]|jgi:uncharacterized protein (DUF1697 family)